MIESMQASPVARVIISISAMLFAGFAMTRITKRLRLPNVTGYILAGILMGPCCLNVIPQSIIDGTDFLSDVALAFIAFSAGEFFKIDVLKRNGAKVIVITVLEACLASVAVFALVYGVLHLELSFSIVLAALACVATMVVQIPSPMNGYVNLGDCFVLLSGWLLGPWWGAAAGGIGSMLADLLLGYGHYAPGTLVIKGLMALVGALVFKAFGKSTVGTLVSGVVSEVIMVAGYFGYAALLLGKGIGAAASIPGNLVQGAVGLVAGFLLMQVARRTHLEEKVSV